MIAFVMDGADAPSCVPIIVDDVGPAPSPPRPIACSHKRGRCYACSGSCRQCDCTCSRRPRGRPRKRGGDPHTPGSIRARPRRKTVSALSQLLLEGDVGPEGRLADHVEEREGHYPPFMTKVAAAIDLLRPLAGGDDSVATALESLATAIQDSSAWASNGLLRGGRNYAGGQGRKDTVKRVLTALISDEKERNNTIEDAIRIPHADFTRVASNNVHRGRLCRVLERAEKGLVSLLLTSSEGLLTQRPGLRVRTSSPKDTDMEHLLQACSGVIASEQRHDLPNQRVAYALLSTIDEGRAVAAISAASAKYDRGQANSTIERHLRLGKKRLPFLLEGVEMPTAQQTCSRVDDESVELAVKVIMSDDSVCRMSYTKRRRDLPGGDLPIGVLQLRRPVTDIYATYEAEHAKLHGRDDSAPRPLKETTFRAVTAAVTGGGRPQEAREGVDFIRVTQHHDNFALINLMTSALLSIDGERKEEVLDMQETVNVFLKDIYKTHIRAHLRPAAAREDATPNDLQVLSEQGYRDLLKAYNEMDALAGASDPSVDGEGVLSNVRARLRTLNDQVESCTQAEFESRRNLHSLDPTHDPSYALDVVDEDEPRKPKPANEMGQVLPETRIPLISCSACRSVFAFYDYLRAWALDVADTNAALAADVMLCCHQCEQRTARFMAHVLRDEVQSLATSQAMEQKNMWAATAVFDYKQKFLSSHFREGSDSYYAKRGVSWFGMAIRFHQRDAPDSKDDGDDTCTAENGCGDLHHWRTHFVDVIVDGDQSQDWFAAASCIEAALTVLRSVVPAEVRNLTLISDNARNFSNYNLLLCLPTLSSCAGWELKDYINNEPGCGKGPADTHFAHQANRIRAFVNQDRGAVKSPTSLYAALSQCRVVDTEIARIQMDPKSELSKMRKTLHGVSSIKHVHYEGNKLHGKLSSQNRPSFTRDLPQLGDHISQANGRDCLTGVRILQTTIQRQSDAARKAANRIRDRVQTVISPRAQRIQETERDQDERLHRARQKRPQCEECLAVFTARHYKNKHVCPGRTEKKDAVSRAVAFAKHLISCGQHYTAESNATHLASLFNHTADIPTTFEVNFAAGWGHWRAGLQPKFSSRVKETVRSLWQAGSAAATVDRRNRNSSDAVHDHLLQMYREGEIRLHECPVPAAIRSRYQAIGEAPDAASVREAKSCTELRKFPAKVMREFLLSIERTEDADRSKEDMLKALCEEFNFEFKSARDCADPEVAASCSDKRLASLSKPTLLAFILSKEPDYSSAGLKKQDLVEKARQLR